MVCLTAATMAVSRVFVVRRLHKPLVQPHESSAFPCYVRVRAALHGATCLA